jgi:hypothetical protein
MITLIFAGLIGLTLVLAVVFYSNEVMGGESSFMVFAFLSLLILVSFYADWMLGSMVGNLVGVLSGDNALLYWLYFATKRLNMLDF